jgi:glycosyltransferase involved in cell wall biosynthesis
MYTNSKISIISPSKNTGRFAKETIESIMSQSYSNWEHIIVDGKSIDETKNIVLQYPQIFWISEEDSSPDEAFRKGLAIANGEYVMFCGISDGYLDRKWFERCVNILDNNLEISLVWGLPQYMSEEGVLGRIAYDHFFDFPPPQKKDFFYYWLSTHFHLTEGNFCVRKKVMEECYPMIDPEISERESLLTFNYNFNKNGYLPYFIPVVANYGRIHCDAGGQRQLADGRMHLWYNNYNKDIEDYTNQLLKGKATFKYRDGLGNFLPDKVDLFKIWYDFSKKRIKRFLINHV